MTLTISSLALCTLLAFFTVSYRRKMLTARAGEKRMEEALMSALGDGEVHELVQLRLKAHPPQEQTPCSIECKHFHITASDSQYCHAKDDFRRCVKARPLFSSKNGRCLVYEPSKYARR